MKKKKKTKKRHVEVYPTFTDYYEGTKLKKRRGIGGTHYF